MWKVSDAVEVNFGMAAGFAEKSCSATAGVIWRLCVSMPRSACCHRRRFERAAVGELVIAVGNPLGFIGAASTGVVHGIETGGGLLAGFDWPQEIPAVRWRTPAAR